VKRVPRWLIVVVAIVVLLVIVALVVPYFLDVDRYRTLIASSIEKETGRKVTIGKIHARLLPSVGFTVDAFALGNPPGFAAGNLVSAESLRGSLAWVPLLRREFQLSSIEIVRPRIVLLENDQGKTNYDFGAVKQATPAAGGSTFRLADIDSIRLSGVECVLGRVTGAQGKLVEEVRVTNVNAKLSNVALDAKRLKQWKVEADVSGVEMRIAGFKSPVQFHSGEFTLRDGAAESNFEFSLGKVAHARGNMRVADIEKAVATFELTTPLADLDQLTAENSGPPVPPPAPVRTPGSELVARGRVAADKVRYSPYEGSKASAEIRVFTDRIEVWPATMALYDGSLGVSARVDRRQSPPRFSANVELRNLDVGKLLAASPQTRGKMTGTAELTLQLFGTQGAKLLDSLTGRGNFAIRDGRFPSLSLSGAMQTLGKLQKVLTFGAGSGGFAGETIVRSITGDLNVADSRVSSNRIHLDSDDGTVDVRGSFGFDQTLNYDGQAMLMRSSTGEARGPAGAVLGVIGGVMKQTVGRITVPFAVRGTFSDPKIQPGRGIPTISTGSQQQPTTQQQQQQKKKGLLNLFRKP
jgi:uncharacterized protein involved in outer membrane biogenesis